MAVTAGEFALPGYASAQESLSAFDNGDYLRSSIYAVAAGTEVTLAVLTYGMSAAVFAGARVAARTIPWSSKAVRDAAKALQNGATDVRVASRSQAEELFLARYQGSGFRNTTGMSPREAKDFYGGKAGTYHWDTGAGAYPHGSSHLQIHTYEGQVVRIFFPD